MVVKHKECCDNLKNVTASKTMNFVRKEAKGQQILRYEQKS